MNSSNSSKPSTGENSNGMLSKMKQGGGGKWGIIVFAVISIGMFIGSFVSMSNFVGSKDDWNVIKPQITKILILTLIGTLGLTIASLLYYVQDPDKTIYFILVLVCVSFGLSFSSLATAAISR